MRLPEPFYESYIAADPFPHAIFDDVFPAYILNQVLEEWPGDKAPWGSGVKSFQQVNKRGLADYKYFGSTTQDLLNLLNSQQFVIWLEALTGIKNIIPDPMLVGGGLHEIFPGGLLKIHADFNHHPLTKLDRRLNVLIYLNENWDEKWGGEFQLYNKDMTKCVVSIPPIFNRMAVFSTTSFSYHGHPDPLRCPPGRSRRSIAMYYYTNGRPAEEEYSNHTTLFQARNRADKIAKFRDLVKKFVPPILYPQYKAKKK